MNEWKQFFNESIAQKYEEYCFTQNTEAEVRFILEECNLPDNTRILDVGCGTGRHAVALARMGFQVTGVDLSPNMLAIAAQNAAAAGVAIDLRESDAQTISFDNEFDAAVCLCEGSLSLVGSADDPIDHDQRILTNICNALKPGATFITTVLNAYRRIREATDQDVESGTFNPVTLVNTNRETVETPEGTHEVEVRERTYTPPEFIRMLQTAGFVVDHLYGGTAGAWKRQTLKLDEMEIMAIAHKPDTHE